MLFAKNASTIISMVIMVSLMGGCATDNYMDTQVRDLEADLAEELARREIEIERMADGSLRLHLDSEMLFDVGSAKIKPAFQRSLGKLGRVITKYERSKVRVVGHADNQGKREYNQKLSEERAQSVAESLNNNGVPKNRMSVEGRGETQPRASNDTEAGRRSNRRVEISLYLP